MDLRYKHYLAAENLLDAAELEPSLTQQQLLIARAHVHATLATVEKTVEWAAQDRTSLRESR